MQEFDTVSVSSFEAASLAAKLTERSADGWDVVAIVPAGSEVTAYLRRSSESGSTAAADAAPEATPAGTATTSEPAGWGQAPAAAEGADTGWGSTSTTTPADTSSSWGAGTTTDTAAWGSGSAAASSSDAGSPWGQTAAAPTNPAPAAPNPAPAPAVPAGWYADPAGRYELRYWDGSAWTERVARAGQQYTDPPVA